MQNVSCCDILFESYDELPFNMHIVHKSTNTIVITFILSLFLLGVLTINIYNEQIFTLLYIWVHFVLVVTIYDFLSWLIFLILPRLRYTFLIERIQTQESAATVRAGMQAFVYDYLQHDGFFVFRLIYANAGDDVTSSILTNLWKNFQRADKSAMAENTTANAGAAISLTGNNDGHDASMFDYSRASTNL